MPVGTTNFLQIDPNATNAESDTTYAADTTRSGGLVTNQIVASPFLNKVLYQLSTYITAQANALVAKGYSPNDGSATPSTALANLAAVFSYLMTAVDVITEVSIGSESGYIVFGPTFGGLTIEWGGTGSIATGSHIISFPSDFQHNVPAVLLSPGAGSTTQYNVTAVGLDNFTVNVTGTGALFFLAIGS